MRHDDAAFAVATATEEGYSAGGPDGMRKNMLPVQKQMVDRGLGSPYELTGTYASLGKKEEPLRYLQTAYEKREVGLLFLNHDANFNVLHDGLAYQEITERVAEKLSKPGEQ